MPAAAKRGMYYGNRCIDDHLVFNMRYFTHDVFIKRVASLRKKDRAGTRKSRLSKLSWSASSSGRDASPTPDQAEAAINEAMTLSLEEEARSVCERHPDIVQSMAESPVVGSMSQFSDRGSSAPRFVEPVEKLLRNFDALYAVKRKDIQALVEDHMDPIERRNLALVAENRMLHENDEAHAKALRDKDQALRNKDQALRDKDQALRDQAQALHDKDQELLELRDMRARLDAYESRRRPTA